MIAPHFRVFCKPLCRFMFGRLWLYVQLRLSLSLDCCTMCCHLWFNWEQLRWSLSFNFCKEFDLKPWFNLMQFLWPLVYLNYCCNMLAHPCLDLRFYCRSCKAMLFYLQVSKLEIKKFDRNLCDLAFVCVLKCWNRVKCILIFVSLFKCLTLRSIYMSFN